MRLLAYGGTSFTERRRIGDWPDLPDGIFQDRSRLRADAPSFGVGLLSGAPFLIYRELQNVTSRGGYAYTLLLDPGRQVWQRAGWNGARLALAALQGETALSEQLRQMPEALEGEKLDEAFGSLDLAPGEPSSGGALGDLMIGASLTEAVSEICRIALEDGWEELTLERVAVLLDAIPQCFRCARGWLIGGTAAAASHLGAQLLIEGGGLQRSPETDSVIIRGRIVREAWERVGGEELPAELRALEILPVWEWREQTALEPRAVIDRVIALAALADPALSIDERLARFGTTDIKPGFLSAEIEAALCRLARAGDGMLSRAQTEYLLRDIFVHGRDLPVEIWPRLDQELMIEKFVSRDLPLVEFRDRFDRALLERLAEEAREGVRRQRAGWMEDYLAFGNDPGGLWLEEVIADGLIGEEVVRQALAAAQGQGKGVEIANEWLRALVRSPLRQRISPRMKDELAQRHPKEWAGWRALKDAIAGTPIEEMPELDDWEREYLFFELCQMLEARRDSRSEATRIRLEGMLGALPEEIGRMFPRREPPVEAAEPDTGDAPPSHDYGPNLFPAEPGEVFFSGGEAKDEEARKRGEELLDRLAGDEDGLQWLVEEFRRSLADPKQRANFARRFAFRRPMLERLCALLEPTIQDGIIEAMSLLDRQRFEDFAFHVVRDSAQDGRKPEALELAISRYLETPAGQRLKKKIDRWMEEWQEGEAGLVEEMMNLIRRAGQRFMRGRSPWTGDED